MANNVGEGARGRATEVEGPYYRVSEYGSGKVVLIKKHNGIAMNMK